MSNYVTVTRSGNKYIKRIEIRKPDGTVAGSISVTKTAKKKNKRLSYNYKEISGRILRSRTSGIARQTVASARTSVTVLQRMRRTGDYDEREMQSAILHAEAIVRVAKKKMKHLLEEEKAKKGGPCEGEIEEKTEEFTEEERQRAEQPVLDMQALQDLLEQCRELMQEAMEELEDLSSMSELSEELLLACADGEMDPEDLEQLKKKHRAEELRDIMEADMRYLKAMFDRLAKEKQEHSSGIGTGGGSTADGCRSDGGVSLQLGGVDIPVETPTVDAAALAEGAYLDTTV